MCVCLCGCLRVSVSWAGWSGGGGGGGASATEAYLACRLTGTVAFVPCFRRTPPCGCWPRSTMEAAPFGDALGRQTHTCPPRTSRPAAFCGYTCLPRGRSARPAPFRLAHECDGYLGYTHMGMKGESWKMPFPKSVLTTAAHVTCAHASPLFRLHVSTS